MELELLHQGSCVSAAPATHSSSKKNQTLRHWPGLALAMLRPAAAWLQGLVCQQRLPTLPLCSTFSYILEIKQLKVSLSTRPQTINQRSTNSFLITTPCSNDWKLLDAKVLKELKTKLKKQTNNRTHQRFKVRAFAKIVVSPGSTQNQLYRKALCGHISVWVPWCVCEVWRKHVKVSSLPPPYRSTGFAVGSFT